MVKNLSSSIVDSKSGGLLSSSDSVVMNILSCGDTSIVDVAVAIQDLILILDEGHFANSSADIGARDVY